MGHGVAEIDDPIGVVPDVAIGLGALAVLDAEQDVAEANISSFGDALWWAATPRRPSGTATGSR